MLADGYGAFIDPLITIGDDPTLLGQTGPYVCSTAVGDHPDTHLFTCTSRMSGRYVHISASGNTNTSEPFSVSEIEVIGWDV